MRASPKAAALLLLLLLLPPLLSSAAVAPDPALEPRPHHGHPVSSPRPWPLRPLPAAPLGLFRPAAVPPRRLAGYTPPASSGCSYFTVEPVPAAVDSSWEYDYLQLDRSFYKKIVGGGAGVPVAGSEKVSDEALLAAQRVISYLLAGRPDIVQTLRENKVKVTIIATTEVTTDVPEYRTLAQDWPNSPWDDYRGIGATRARPASSVGEENVLCNADDIYRGENILVHEFGHTMTCAGSGNPGASWTPRIFANADGSGGDINDALKAAYDAAKQSGKWQNTYAHSNPVEYAAEGVQTYFDANKECSWNCPDGIHNNENTRSELEAYDQTLYDLMVALFPETPSGWRPDSRLTDVSSAAMMGCGCSDGDKDAFPMPQWENQTSGNGSGSGANCLKMNGACVSTCPSDHFRDESDAANPVCTPCGNANFCATCTSVSVCTSCMSNKYLNVQGECVASCPSGQVPNEEGRCVLEGCDLTSTLAQIEQAGGDAGSCSGITHLAHGTSCQPICASGHTISGPTSCSAADTSGSNNDADCTDDEVHCPAWASGDPAWDCDGNPGYMLVYCKKSCNVCTVQTSDGGGGGVLTPSQCSADPCDLTKETAIPAHGSNTEGGSDCETTWQGLLPSGSSCSPTCEGGYSLVGKTECRNGALTVATCRSDGPAPCTNARDPVAHGTFGNCPETLDSGDDCQPVCDAGYSLLAVGSELGHSPTLSHTCEDGVLTKAKCSLCTPTCGNGEYELVSCSSSTDRLCRACNTQACAALEPPLFLGGCGGSNPGVCQECPPKTVFNPADHSCVIAPCTLPPSLPTSIVGSGGADQCMAGSSIDHGTQCGVKCAAGYEDANAGHTDVYLCRSSVLTPPSLQCVPNNCTMPTSLPPHTVPGSSTSGTTSPCQSNGGILADSHSCAIACASGYEPSSGSGSSPTEYSCALGSLSTPSLQCVAQGCDIPSTFPNNFVGDTCTPGTTLDDGAYCTVRCKTGFESVGGGTTRYSCGTGTMVTPTINCQPQKCLLPYSFPSYTVGTSSICTTRGTLDDGQSCNVRCIDGYEPSNQGATVFTCTQGSLSEPSLQCRPKGCTLPPTLPDRTTAAAYKGCSPGEFLDSGGYCELQCRDGYTRASGATQYSCSLGVLTPPSDLLCIPDSCALPNTLPQHTTSIGAPNPGCVAQQSLADGMSCALVCAEGYATEGSATLTFNCSSGNLTGPQAAAICVPASCILPTNLSSYSQGIDNNNNNNTANGCLAGATLADSTECAVACLSGYRDNGGTSVYACSMGELIVPTLSCEEQGCQLPSTLPGNTKGGGGPNPCASGVELSPGQSCDVMCETGYEARATANGGEIVSSDAYVCNSGGSMTLPSSLQCFPKKCPLPARLGNNVVGSGALPCIGGRALEHDTSCSVGCPEGYYKESGTETYTCDLGSMVLTATIVCVPQSCALPLSFGSHVTGSDVNHRQCVAGSTIPDGETCDVSCANGFESDSGSDESSSQFECRTGALTAPSLSCVAKKCTVPSNFLAHMTSVGAPTPSCVAGGLLDSGTTCGVKCYKGYAPTSADAGSMQYSCTEGVITGPGSSCAPASCGLPSALPPYLTGDNGTNACLGGATLSSGAACSVKCIGDYHAKSGLAGYSCEKGVLQEPAIVCEIPGCTLPNAFNAHTIGASTQGSAGDGGDMPACIAGETLTDGSSCSLSCQEGYHGNDGATALYSCDKGSMSVPNLICSPKPCQIPVTFGNKVIGSGAAPCVPGSTLSDASACQVECAPGWQRVSGSDNFQCSLGNVVPATLSCAPMGCLLPSAFPGNVVSSEGSNACQQGGTLLDSTSCKVSCAAGFEDVNAGTSSVTAATHYSCSEGKLTKPSLSCVVKSCSLNVLPALMTGVGSPTPSCASGLTLLDASSCNLDCVSGYMPSATGRMVFSCSFGSLTAPTATCVPASCPLPAPLPSYLQGGDTNGCTNGGILSSSSSCSIQCRHGLMAKAGTTAYSCDTGQLTEPSLVCEVEGCTIDAFPLHAVGSSVSSGMSACVAGETLSSGQSCHVACEAGFEATSASGTTAFACNAGRLSLPTLSCAPAGCSLPLAGFGAHVVGTGNAPCVAGALLNDQASCRVSCEKGWQKSSSGDTFDYACKKGVLESPSLSCQAMPCTIPLGFGNHVVGAEEVGVEGCVKGATLLHGSSCKVKCETSRYEQSGGTNTFACSAGLLTVPTLTCAASERPVVAPSPQQVTPVNPGATTPTSSPQVDGSGSSSGSSPRGGGSSTMSGGDSQSSNGDGNSQGDRVDAGASNSGSGNAVLYGVIGGTGALVLLVVVAFVIWTRRSDQSKHHLNLRTNASFDSSGGIEFSNVAAAVAIRMEDGRAATKSVGHRREVSLVLPPVWVEHIDPSSQHPFYFNTVTGETVWEKPVLDSEKVLDNESHHRRKITVMPRGWQRYFDDSGNRYYAMPDGTVTWNKPGES